MCQQPTIRPPELTVKPSIDSQSVAKATRVVLRKAIERSDFAIFSDILEKHPLRKAMRIEAWVKRFIDNARQNSDNRTHGPLTSEEVEKQHMS